MSTREATAEYEPVLERYSPVILDDSMQSWTDRLVTPRRHCRVACARDLHEYERAVCNRQNATTAGASPHIWPVWAGGGWGSRRRSSAGIPGGRWRVQRVA